MICILIMILKITNIKIQIPNIEPIKKKDNNNHDDNDDAIIPSRLCVEMATFPL